MTAGNEISPMDGTIWSVRGYSAMTSPPELKAYFLGHLAVAGFQILNTAEHHFSPQGYTRLELLAESHFAIHTFPENNTTYFELSSCVKQKFDEFVALLRADQAQCRVVSVSVTQPPVW